MRERYDELISLINYHNNRYYNMDEPEISDYEYDKLMIELRELEKEHPNWVTPDSPSQKVGGVAKREAGMMVRHRVPMLSLQDVFSKEDVYKFVEDMKKALGSPEFVVETKIDGLSMAIRYEEGNLTTAITRGDGIVEGEDVTANALVIKDVKKKLKNPVEYLEIRGEVYMTNESFNEVNKQQELLGKKTFANPRNCAAGTLRQLNSKVTKERNLSMFVFNIQEIRGMDIKTHIEGYEFLRSNDIKIIDNYKLCRTADEVWEAIQEIGEERDYLPYDIDGAVVKVNSFADREKVGASSKVPKWSVAFKYPTQEEETVIREIELSVGRTGRINPTAIFEPIRLCGTTVSRATLHNQDFIDKLGIDIGSKVTVYKSGEIIPKIRAVTGYTGTVYKIPNLCPVCGQPVVREEDTADIKCVNSACPSQLERIVSYFVSRDCMDIKGFGEKYIKALIDEGYIKDYADIYSLKNYRDELVEKGIIGKEKNTDKILKAIEDSKDNDPVMLLTALGIHNVGKASAKEIMKHYQDILILTKATVDELKEIQDVGIITAETIVEFFNNSTNIQVLNKLIDAGVNTAVQNKEDSSERLKGLTFVVTGTLPTLGRKEATELIEQNGGKCSSSVSKKTDYVLAGENAGSKLDKAADLGVKVISEEELLNMIK